MPTSRRPPPREATSGGRRRWIAAAVVTLLAVPAAVLLLRRGPDRLAEVRDLQHAALAAGAAPAADLGRIVRSADRLGREDLRAARDELLKDWRRHFHESRDRYLAAPAAERTALLDEQIDRMTTVSALLDALDPMARPGRVARLPKPDGTPGPAAVAYQQALLDRARQRRVALPAFR